LSVKIQPVLSMYCMTDT